VKVLLHAPATFLPGKEPPVSNGQEAGWVVTKIKKKSFLASAGNPTPIAQPAG